MINCEYTLVRNDGTTQRIFKPDKISGDLPNLVYIEGPNSSGKSTFLNILALGFYGLNNDKINISLRKKIQSLLESKHQNIKFTIKLNNKNDTLTLESIKNELDKKEILIYENGNILSQETFHKKYNLIYDIPENPTERLNQLTQLIKTSQDIYGNKIAVFRKHIRNVILEIENSKDPSKIEELRNELNLCIKDSINLEDEFNLLSSDLNLIEKLLSCKFYVEYTKEKFKQENLKRKLVNEIKNKERKEKKISIEKMGLIQGLKLNLEDMKKDYDELTYLLKILIPSKHDNYLSLWERINVNNSFHDLEIDQNLKRLLISFGNILDNILDNEFVTEFNQAKIYNELITLLENYSNVNIIIPGIDKSIPEFISILKQNSIKHQNTLLMEKNINQAKSLIKNLENIISNLESNFFPKLKYMLNNNDKEYYFEEYADSNEIPEIEKKLIEIEEKCKFYLNQCIKKDIFLESIETTLSDLNNIPELAPYFNYSENQLADKTSDLEKRISQLKKDMKKKEHQKKELELEINRLENMPPHPYREYSKYLNELLQLCLNLEKKMLNDYHEYIINILKKKNLSSDNITVDQEKYYEAVSVYLGNRVGYIRHIDRNYEVDKIDLIQGVIHTKDKNIINLTDMGTGQSQSAYLIGLLNSEDDRKIIALFDEVAMMDSYSLAPIFEKFRELYNKDRLIFGAVVQKADEMKIISLL